MNATLAAERYSTLRILVVEDDDFVRAMTSQLLEELGVGEIVAATNGREALERLKDRGHEINCVLCDLEMPEMDGFEFLRRLRENPSPAIAHLPVIVLSGHRTATVVDQVMAYRIAGFLVKPATIGDLGYWLDVLAGSSKSSA